MHAGNLLFISDENLERLLDALAQGGKVYLPGISQDREGRELYPYLLRKPGMTFAYRGYRPVQPLKTFLFVGRDKVAEYPSHGQSQEITEIEKAAVVGAAACDIESLKTFKAVFLGGDHPDIFYMNMLDATTFITIDCTSPRETCFCTLAGHSPYPTAGFDLNLSRVERGYIVEAGSERGEKIIEENLPLFSPPGGDMLVNREQKRLEARRIIEETNRHYSVPRNRREILERMREHEEWYDHVSTCVECGACLFSCPTCHCFLLYDQAVEGGVFNRIREWDACIYAGYSRMAGGSSPRLGLMERFRHRYLHKLEYFPKNFGFESCTGCGRCIEGCMGKIDMRKVLKALDSETVGA